MIGLPRLRRRRPSVVAFGWQQKLAEAKQARVEVFESVLRSLERRRVVCSQVLGDSARAGDELAEHPGKADVAAFKCAEPRLEFSLVHGGTLFYVGIGVKP